MKTKSFLLTILFIFLMSFAFVGCSPNLTDEDLYDENNELLEKSASGKGSQGSPGGKGGVEEPDDL